MILRFLFFAFLGYALYRIIRWMVGPGAKGTREGNESGGIVDEMVQDPVCKMYVRRRDSVKRVIGGDSFFFCSEKCAARFEEEHSE